MYTHETADLMQAIILSNLKFDLLRILYYEVKSYYTIMIRTMH